jgi:hypothetical protein
MANQTFEVKSLGELSNLIIRHVQQREARVRAGITKTSRDGRNKVEKEVPVAFDELRSSVHNDGDNIVVDAPHAAAVNLGSRPHWAPLEPLIAWVKLRGMQGLTKTGRLKKSGFGRGKTTAEHASRVAYELNQREKGWSSDVTTREVSGGALDVDAPRDIARRIQIAIAAKGTKPHHFIEESIPHIARTLRRELREAIDHPVE